MTGINPPNLWDWLYHMAAREHRRDLACCLLGMNREGLKRRYYAVSYGEHRFSPASLWIMRMVGQYHRLFPEMPIPDCYPVGHQFERIADIRTANFNRKESAMNHTAYGQPAPAWGSAPGTIPTPEDRIKQGEAIIASAEADIAERTRREELGARLDYEFALAQATAELIRTVRGILLQRDVATQNLNFAKFRKELQPLADSYGFRIVLVGDKSVAVLTQ